MNSNNVRDVQAKIDPAELNDWYESLDSLAARYDSDCVAGLLHALRMRAEQRLPEGAETGILKGMYRLRSVTPERTTSTMRPQLFGSRSLLSEVLRAQEILAEQFEMGSDVWSVTSYCQLRRDAQSVDRINAMHPEAAKQYSYLEEALNGLNGPFVAVTDYVKLVPDQIRQWIPGRYEALGTDGFGRSDTRAALRSHFEVEAEHVVYATLRAFGDSSDAGKARLSQAMQTLGIDPVSMDPVVA